mmetsp:Transcript_24773/g.62287  ORF Transcript_24773/g.62287 Transcript_24773/m.62287 type:complete len:384 (-) Transcript_24773:576-1727(-)
MPAGGGSSPGAFGSSSFHLKCLFPVFSSTAAYTKHLQSPPSASSTTLRSDAFKIFSKRKTSLSRCRSNQCGTGPRFTKRHCTKVPWSRYGGSNSRSSAVLASFCTLDRDSRSSRVAGSRPSDFSSLYRCFTFERMGYKSARSVQSQLFSRRKSASRNRASPCGEIFGETIFFVELSLPPCSSEALPAALVLSSEDAAGSRSWTSINKASFISHSRMTCRLFAHTPRKKTIFASSGTRFVCGWKACSSSGVRILAPTSLPKVSRVVARSCPNTWAYTPGDFWGSQGSFGMSFTALTSTKIGINSFAIASVSTGLSVATQVSSENKPGTRRLSRRVLKTLQGKRIGHSQPSSGVPSRSGASEMPHPPAAWSLQNIDADMTAERSR